jgi:hypothetical protein
MKKSFLLMGIMFILVLFSCKSWNQNLEDDGLRKLTAEIDQITDYNLTGSFKRYNLDLMYNGKPVTFKGKYPLFAKVGAMIGESKFEYNAPSTKITGKIIYTLPPLIQVGFFNYEIDLNAKTHLSGKVVAPEINIKSSDYEFTPYKDNISYEGILHSPMQWATNQDYIMTFQGKKITGKRYIWSKDKETLIYFDFKIGDKTIRGKQIGFETAFNKNITCEFKSDLSEEDLFTFLFLAKLFNDFDESRMLAKQM